MDSILTSIKRMILGAGYDEVDVFDTELIFHINSVFMILTQLGVGPEEGFSIKDKEAVWTDFITDINKIEAVKTYVYMKVKLIFDPPASSIVLGSFEKYINEFEWRLNVNTES